MAVNDVYFAVEHGDCTFLPTVEEFYNGIAEEHFETIAGRTEDGTPTTMQVLQCYWTQETGSNEDTMIGGPEITLTPRHVAIIVQRAKEWLGEDALRNLTREDGSSHEDSSAL